MRYALYLFGYEVVSFEIDVLQVDPFEEDEEWDEPESQVICWKAEEHADYTVYPPDNLRPERIVFGEE